MLGNQAENDNTAKGTTQGDNSTIGGMGKEETNDKATIVDAHTHKASDVLFCVHCKEVGHYNKELGLIFRGLLG
jgi:hypothetical protein